MTPEERSLLESTHALTKENNELLHSFKRRAQLGMAVKILYWALIIGLSFGAFYFIQPYIDMIKGIAGGSSNNSANTLSNSYTQQIQDLLN